MKGFLKLIFSVLKTMVPAIATVEEAIKEIKAGAEKKKAVLSIVMATPEIVEALSGKEVIDENLFKQGLSQINEGLVKIMNATRKTVVE